MTAPSSKFPRTDRHVRGILLGAFVIVALFGGVRLLAQHDDGDATMLGTPRTPLVYVSGKTEPLPTADYVSSPGGAGLGSSGAYVATLVDDTGAITRTLPTSATTQILTMPSTNDPTTGTFGLWSNELFEHNGVSPTDYWDKTMQFGYNYNGGRVDASQAATWIQFESNYYQIQFNNEMHISTMGTDGIERRRYSQTSAKDGSTGEAGFAASRMTFLDWDGTTLIAQLTHAIIVLFSTTQIDSDDLHGGIRLKDSTGATSYFAVGSQDSTLSVPLLINSSTQPQLELQNPLNSASGSVSFFMNARNSSQNAVFNMGQDGNLVIEDTGTGAFYMDSRGGFHLRNSSFSNSLDISDTQAVSGPGSFSMGRVISAVGAPSATCDGGTAHPVPTGGEWKAHVVPAIDATTCALTFGHTLVSCTSTLKTEHIQLSTGIGKTTSFTGAVLTVTAAPSWALGDFDVDCSVAN